MDEFENSYSEKDARLKSHTMWLYIYIYKILENVNKYM